MRPLPLFAALLLLAASAACQGSDRYPEGMHEQHRHDAPAPSGAVADVDTSLTVAREVTYATLDGRPVVGYLAMPADADSTAALPGIVVFHEWWGLNDNVRMMTRRLAEGGYAALAVDLYGGRVAQTPDSARALLQAAMQRAEGLMGTVEQAIAHLRGEAGAPLVGVVGWCFGGGWALETALTLPEGVDAAVMYYGRLVTERARLAALDAPLLGHFGTADESIPLADVRAFEQSLRRLDKDVTIHVYEGAGHAFANPSGESYDAEAAQTAWARTTAFFAEHLR